MIAPPLAYTTGPEKYAAFSDPAEFSGLMPMNPKTGFLNLQFKSTPMTRCA